MPYILEAWTHIEQMPRLAWLEATGKDDEVRLTFANSFGVIAEGFGLAEELEAFATSGGDCVCSNDLWIERTDVPHMWSISLVKSPKAGHFRVNAYDLTCGLQQIQLDRMLTGINSSSVANPTPAGRPSVNAFGSLQMVRGTVYDG